MTHDPYPIELPIEDSDLVNSGRHVISESNAKFCRIRPIITEAAHRGHPIELSWPKLLAQSKQIDLYFYLFYSCFPFTKLIFS
jgi:hypothetical protein